MMVAASGRSIRLAVVGASGTVGSQIAELIGARDFSYREVKLFGSESGTSTTVESGEQTFTVTPLESPAELAGFDLVLLAVPETIASEIVSARPGPLLVDLSAATRPPSDAAPVVAPGVTPRERLLDVKRLNLLAIPHPASQVIATVLDAIGVHAGFVGANVMLGASAGGREAISELFNQSGDLLNARLALEDDETQAAFNIFLPAGGRELASAISAQAAALMGAAPELAAHVVQVPAFHGSAVALFVSAADIREWPQRLRSAPGVILVESDEASGFIDAIGQEAVLVRMGIPAAGGSAIWCTFDGARIAALSALWIAETIAFAAS
jgi:aspartate-semialdehyde dehydrogenase